MKSIEGEPKKIIIIFHALFQYNIEFILHFFKITRYYTIAFPTLLAAFVSFTKDLSYIFLENIKQTYTHKYEY